MPRELLTDLGEGVVSHKPLILCEAHEGRRNAVRELCGNYGDGAPLHGRHDAVQASQINPEDRHLGPISLELQKRRICVEDLTTPEKQERDETKKNASQRRRRVRGVRMRRSSRVGLGKELRLELGKRKDKKREGKREDSRAQGCKKRNRTREEREKASCSAPGEERRDKAAQVPVHPKVGMARKHTIRAGSRGKSERKREKMETR